MGNKDFEVQCACCGLRISNWTGSTPCCGSIAYLVNEDGSVSKRMSIFVSFNGGEISSREIDFEDGRII